jgi:hypothetical protein
MADYGHSNMTVLFWHVSDSYATSETEARADYYGVGGIPDVWFDGVERVLGGGTYMRPYYEPIILRHLEEDPYVSIDLSGSSIDENGGTLNIHLEVLQTIGWTDCKVRCVVYQNNIIGEDFLVRDVLPLDDLTIRNVGETQDLVKPFVINQNWYGQVNAEDISVAVFVQSEYQKNVLNTCDLSKVDVEITPESATVPMGSDLDYTAHLTNITPWRQSIQTWIDAILPNGDEYGGNPIVEPVLKDLPGGATVDHDMTISIPNGIATGDYKLRLCVGEQSNPNNHWEYDFMTVTVTE